MSEFAMAVAKWIQIATWLLLSGGILSYLPEHMRKVLKEECEKVIQIAEKNRFLE